jgi:diguanylate cyclase (GGDEF)-like protein
MTRWSQVLLLASTSALAVVALGLAGSPLAVSLGAVLSGLMGVSGGVAVARRALPARRGDAFRLLIGAAAVIWGVGQTLVGVLVPYGATYPTVGDLVSLLAGPVAIVGLALSPRRTSEPLAGLRLACDALVAGGVAAALAWRVAFSEVVDPGTVSGALAIVIIVIELTVVALLFVAALRDLDPGMVTVAVGVALFVLADVHTQYVVVQPGGTWPWPAMALTCLAWPLVCSGLVRIGAHPPDISDRDRPASEQRRTVVAGGVTAGMLGVLLLTVALGSAVDLVTVLLLAVSLAGVAVRDVVVARQAHALLHRVSDLAYRDALTGLGNRRALLERLHAHRDRSDAWLLTVDLDNFKSVNGLLGHGGGDELLARAGEQLAAACGDADQVFRLGGDEFAVLVTGERESVTVLAERLVLAVRLAALSVPGVGRVALSASVGVAALRPADAPMTALAESAAALNNAKTGGRNQCVVYEGGVAAKTRRRRLVEVRLRDALDRGELVVHAQPIVRLDSGRVTGVEMLARWVDRELGRVNPAEFIDIAEASSLIVPLGDHVLDVALAEAAARRFDERDVSVGVNVSPVQLRVPGFAESVLDRLGQHGISPSRFVLEVTEQIFVAEDDAAEIELRRLAAAGVNVAVDDFGAGSASLGYLRRMPGRILKIDRSLVASMLRDPRSAAIVSSMARLGAETGLDVVAEGIEDEATAAACRAAGIPYGQGWHFARDVPLDEVDDLLDRLGARPQPVSPSA